MVRRYFKPLEAMRRLSRRARDLAGATQSRLPDATVRQRNRV